MADQRIPPTTPLGTPPHTTAGPNPTYPTNTTTTHIRETKPTNWFAYLLGGAVIAVGIAALVLSGDDAPVTTPGGDNNVTIESPATAPAAEAPAADVPAADAPAADAPAADAPAATTPEAPAVTPDAPAADPAAPAPDAATPDAGTTAPDAGTTAPAPAN